MKYPQSIQNLISHFSKLPGIGPKTAQRLVLYLVNKPKGDSLQFASALQNLHKSITNCSECFNVSQTNPCEICKNPERDSSFLCVVARSVDVLAIEKTGQYFGKYYVLGGTINPIEGITAETLTIQKLLDRVEAQKVREVILGMNPDMAGETTTLHLVNILRPLGVKTSRLGRGLSMGSELEYADEVTLKNALNGRKEV
jgi:recombination protein RecR